MQTLPGGREGTGGSSSSNRLEPGMAMPASPFADASSLVDSRRTSVPSGATQMGQPELVPSWVLGSPRAFATSGMRAKPGEDAEPGFPTGAGLIRAVVVLVMEWGSWGR